MIVLLYIFTLPSPRVFTSASALAVQYPCFPHKQRVTGPMTKGNGSGDMNDG